MLLWWQEWSARWMLATLRWMRKFVTSAMRASRTAKPQPQLSPHPRLAPRPYGQSSGAVWRPTPVSSNTCLGVFVGNGRRLGHAEGGCLAWWCRDLLRCSAVEEGCVWLPRRRWRLRGREDWR